MKRNFIIYTILKVDSEKSHCKLQHQKIKSVSILLTVLKALQIASMILSKKSIVAAIIFVKHWI